MSTTKTNVLDEGAHMAKLIMVVNDTQEILDMFRELLTGEGYEVSLHAYGKRETEEVIRVGPDLIISDWPPLDREVFGWQFIQLLKMNPKTAHIPIIVCTTNLRSIEDNQAWMTSKGIRVVAKPFEVNDLFKAIKTMIGEAEEAGAGPASLATSGLEGPHHGPEEAEIGA